MTYNTTFSGLTRTHHVIQHTIQFLFAQKNIYGVGHTFSLLDEIEFLIKFTFLISSNSSFDLAASWNSSLAPLKSVIDIILSYKHVS